MNIKKYSVDSCGSRWCGCREDSEGWLYLVEDIEPLLSELAELRACKEAMESQPPIGLVKTVGGYPDDSEHVVEWLVKYRQITDGQHLYANPIPSHSQQRSLESAYREGWEAGWAERHTSLENNSRVRPWVIPACAIDADWNNSEAKKLYDDRCPSHESEQANQCDGCMASMALKEGNLHMDFAGNSVMVCQADRYRVE